MKLSKVLIASLVFAACTFSQKSFQREADFHNKFLRVNQEVNPNFIKAIDKAMKKLLKEHNRSIHVVGAVEKERLPYFNDFLSILTAKLNENFQLRFDMMEKINLVNQNTKQNTMFIIDGIKKVRTLFKSINPEMYKMSDNFLFVLLDGCFDELQNIFNAFWKKDFHRVYAIYETVNDVEISSFIPFQDPQTCGNTKPKVIAKFQDGKLLGEFPRRLKLQMCPIRIVTFPYKGNVDVNEFKNGSYELSGKEVDLMNTLSNELNYTNEIIFNKEDDPWGTVYKNGTITGSLGDLQRNIADFALAEFFLRPLAIKYFDPTTTLYTTPMVFIIPPGKLFGHFEKLAKPFHRVLWIAVLGTFGSAILVILLVNTRSESIKSFIYGHKVKTPLINLLLAIVGLGQTKLPGHNFARFLLMMFLMLCLVLRNIYQGSLFQILQSDQRHKEVQSIDEMIKKDFKFILYEIDIELIRNKTEIFKRTKLLNAARNPFLNGGMTGEENTATIEPLSSIQAEIYQGTDIHYLKESLVTFNVVSYFRKNFYFRDQIDRKIENLVSSGIIDYWQRGSYKFFGCHIHKKNEPRKLNAHDLHGIFILLIAGLFGASIVFMLEMLVRKF